MLDLPDGACYALRVAEFATSKSDIRCQYSVYMREEQLRYEVILYWSEVIIREWLETAREEHRPIPEPKGRLLFA